MNKLLGLFLLALAFLAPSAANATPKFLVLCAATCVWDNTNDAIWSLSSNGANNTTHPVAGDTVTIDASSCVGGVTCTITTGAVTISASSITWGTCTASTTGCIIDASANNTNFVLSGVGTPEFSGTGSGTRKWLAGTGTYTLTINNTNGCFTMAITTNDQGSVFSGATWNCTTTVANIWTWAGGGFSFGPTTINGNTSFGQISISGTNTFASLTVNAPNAIAFPQAVTTTITGALTLNGSSSNQIMFTSSNLDTVATVSLGAASTANWTAMRVITTSGAAGLTASNCFNIGRITLANGGSCLAPVIGGGGGGRIIGG